MKEQLAKLFKQRGLRYELEWPWIPGRRADIVLPDLNIAVECQASPIAIEEWEERTLDYNLQDCAVLWVWDVRRVYGSRTGGVFPANYEAQYVTYWDGEQRLTPEPEYRVPVEIRNCHAVSGNQILALDVGGLLKLCYLRTAAERNTEYYDQWGDLQENCYTPTTLKRIRTADPCGALEHRSGRYRLAGFAGSVVEPPVPVTDDLDDEDDWDDEVDDDEETPYCDHDWTEIELGYLCRSCGQCSSFDRELWRVDDDVECHLEEA
jgi:hypothetical protein